MLLIFRISPNIALVMLFMEKMIYFREGGSLLMIVVAFASLIGMFIIPILAIIFCINLVEIMKKVKREERTFTNTFWLTASFLLIVWSIAIISLAE